MHQPAVRLQGTTMPLDWHAVLESCTPWQQAGGASAPAANGASIPYKRVLVTGSAGFIGMHTAIKLRQRGDGRLCALAAGSLGDCGALLWTPGVARCRVFRRATSCCPAPSAPPPAPTSVLNEGVLGQPRPHNSVCLHPRLHPLQASWAWTTSMITIPCR